FIEDLARGSQLDRLSGPIQQSIPILLLQLPDLCAHRRLRTEYLFPRTGKAALARYFQECNQLIEVHRLSEIIACGCENSMNFAIRSACCLRPEFCMTSIKILDCT